MFHILATLPFWTSNNGPSGKRASLFGEIPSPNGPSRLPAQCFSFLFCFYAGNSLHCVVFNGNNSDSLCCLDFHCYRVSAGNGSGLPWLTSAAPCPIQLCCSWYSSSCCVWCWPSVGCWCTRGSSRRLSLKREPLRLGMSLSPISSSRAPTRTAVQPSRRPTASAPNSRPSGFSTMTPKRWDPPGPRSPYTAF